MSKKKQKRRFVPRMILTAACTATVVPVCAIEACGGETRGQSASSGTGGSPFGVAADGFDGNGGLQGVAAGGFGAGGGLTVAAAGFGGFGVGAGLGGTGGLPFVAAAGFGGAGGVAAGGFGGAGGVAAGGFGGFTVAAGGFGGYGGFQVAGGAFGVAIGGFGGAIRDSGSDANTSDAAKGGHASLDPDEGAFGELGSGAQSRNGRTRTSKRRRG